MPPKPQYWGEDPTKIEMLTAARRFEIFRRSQGGFRKPKAGYPMVLLLHPPLTAPQKPNLGGTSPQPTQARRWRPNALLWKHGLWMIIATRGGAIRWYNFCPLNAPKPQFWGADPHENREMLMAARRFETFRCSQGGFRKPNAGNPMVPFPPQLPRKTPIWGYTPTTNTSTQMAAKRFDMETRTLDDYSKSMVHFAPLTAP